MHLVTFKKIDAESRDAAQVAIGQDFTGVTELSKKSKKLKPLSKAPESIFIHGHSQRLIGRKEAEYHSIQGLCVEAMVSRLRSLVPNRARRKAVKDIYLLSCEAGWTTPPDNNCYAKELADALHTAGFINLSVHAITSPAERSAEQKGMFVELTTKAGIKGLMTGQHVGHVKAAFSTKTGDRIERQITQLQAEKKELSDTIDQLVKTKNPDEAERLRVLFRERATLSAQIYAVVRELNKEKEAHYFMSVDNLRVEMHRAENTFRHGVMTPVKTDPLLRVAEPRAIASSSSSSSSSTTVTVPVPQDDSALAAIVTDLEVLRDSEDSKGKFSRNINALLQKMSENSHWKSVIIAAMDAYHKPVRSTKPGKFIKNLATNRDRSEFYGLLVHLVREYRLTHPHRKIEGLRQQVEQKLRDKNVPFEHVMIHPGKKSRHVSVLYSDGLSEFKLDEDCIDKSISDWTKKRNPGLSSSSSSDDELAASSTPVAKPNLQDSLVEKLIDYELEIISAPRTKDEQIAFEVKADGRPVTATLSPAAYETQLDFLVRVLGHLEHQGISDASLSFVAVPQGYQIKTGSRDSVILTERNFERDMHDLIQAPPVPIVRIPEPYSDSSDSDANVSHSDSEGSDDELLKRDNRRYKEQFQHRYAYGRNDESRTHIWSPASARNVHFQYLDIKGDECRTLVGDRLKRAILDAFQRELNRYTEPRDLEQIKARMKLSPDYAVLKASQGFTTSALRLFKNTDSLNAFNQMTQGIRDVDVDPQWGPGSNSAAKLN